MAQTTLLNDTKILPNCVSESEVLNVIKERQKLDQLYEENYKKQSTLLWQYIGSPSGVLSMYPGI